ncbi:hypothetical protein [Alkalibaculum bacchi]|uniref:hypothetical protein n=1 Tax=Alkalibaculum bacchi TaxID=645887 RepID=UPI0026EA22F6|nr:hypothetical protein [Alkalibaculum bacchi]
MIKVISYITVTTAQAIELFTSGLILGMTAYETAKRKKLQTTTNKATKTII